MINALEAARITIKAPNDCEVCWNKIEKELETEIISAAKYGNTKIRWHVDKYKGYIAGMLMNLGYIVNYDSSVEERGILEISWANKNNEARILKRK